MAALSRRDSNAGDVTDSRLAYSLCDLGALGGKLVYSVRLNNGTAIENVTIAKTDR